MNKKHKFLEAFFRLFVKGAVRVVYNLKYTGFEKIPQEGPALLISNHVSYMDGLIIDAAIKRPIRFIMDRSIFHWPGVNYFMSIYRAIPIEPTRESVEAALEEAANALKNGEIVCIFPEGKITYTGNMTRFRYGVEWILKKHQVPVYPLALEGLWGSIFSRKYIREKYKMMPRYFRKKVTAVCGDAVMPDSVNIGYLQRIVMDLKNSVRR